MGITLNKVNVEIDGKVYQLYKLTFGFQRRLIEVQTNLSKLQTEVAKKYNIEPELVAESDKVPEAVKLEIARNSLELQDALGSLFVNKDDAAILDNFDGDSLQQLIEMLK